MKRKSLRLLSIDLSARGFGFVLLDSRLGLLDWGFSKVSADDDETFVSRIREKVERNVPTALVFENLTPAKERATALRRVGLLVELARHCRLGTCQVSSRIVRDTIGSFTKAEMARKLALRFPILLPRVPPQREPWMDEDDRIQIFDALAFAVAVMDPANFA